MRINQYIALATGVSRRQADQLVSKGGVTVNGQTATLGTQVQPNDLVTLQGKRLQPLEHQTILLHKPVGYVCSRDGQGSPTIYDLLPDTLHHLKPVGRLDKDSSGLLLMTNDGVLAHRLTHPSTHMEKIYEVRLQRPLIAEDKLKLQSGVELQDVVSKLKLTGNGLAWTVTMHEGRNRQIRRTFESLGYRVTKLHRLKIGPYSLSTLPSGQTKLISDN